ncbi:MAG TPA: hypothetical protein VJA25_02635 [Dehalococcoidia bacterium]|nr:hypothetical protein [Dehalococcoidia bacterium]
MATELAPPKGHGLVRVAHNLRQHITRPALWTREPGTDFWVNFGPTMAGAAGDELIATDWGWTLTSITLTAGSLGDLLSSADVGTPTIAALDAGSDLLLGPSIFGDYGHGLQASQFLGYMPTKLCLEVFGNFSVNSVAETTSGFGLSTGSSLTATNHIAFIYSDATNFAIRGTPGTTTYADVGALVDTTYHHWKIVANASGTVDWYIDAVLQGSITLVPDLFPTAFSASVVAGGTNRVNLDWAHVWYE